MFLKRTSIYSTFGRQLCQNCGWAGSELYVRSHITEHPCCSYVEQIFKCFWWESSNFFGQLSCTKSMTLRFGATFAGLKSRIWWSCNRDEKDWGPFFVLSLLFLVGSLTVLFRLQNWTTEPIKTDTSTGQYLF